ADEPVDWPLLRFLSLIGDQGGEVQTLLDRIGYVPVDDGGAPGDTSDLANPATADLAWLPWLGQLVGVHLSPGVVGQAARDAIAHAASGFQVGTKGAIAAAAASVLTGTRYVRVYDHSVAAISDGTQWDVMVVTRTSETSSGPDVLAAIVAQRAKPAGVVLHAVPYSATYTQTRAGTTDTYTARQAMWPYYQDASDYMP
ncbi:MAG: hypothetical protein M3O32_17140, partial [Actinomycetota bacterium]|nr:hypothetical protein [Actinomycetota bacterium]